MIMEDKQWYVGFMERKEAEKKLLHPVNDHGAYLIRVSESQPENFSLSLRVDNTVKHYLIRRNQFGHFLIKRKTFPTLQDLVNHYTVCSEELDGIKLGRPCRSLDEFGNNGTFFPNITDAFETDKDSVKLIRKLGEGRFGEVWEGVWNISTPVAIKSLLYETTEPEHLLDEAQVLKNLQHPHIIKLLAACTIQEPFYLIFELMTKGCLLSYLREKKHKNCLMPLTDIIKIASDVCSGMAYLEKEHYIHRDLKARKVLMGENNSVKVASFRSAKLAKNGWYQDVNVNSKMLSKWAAPEVISRNLYSVKSDVWSFGILLTELVTHGEMPYGKDMSDEITMFKVLQGYRMPPPYGCPPALYDFMKECWQEEPNKRPTFQSLQFKLHDFYTLDPLDYKTN